MDHVGALRDRAHVDARDQSQALRQRARILMILGEPIDHRVQCDEARRRDNAGLAHPAAEQLANPMRARNEILAAAQYRADRTCEALRQAKRNRVGIRGDLLRGGFQRDRRVEDARAIEMHRERAPIRQLANFGEMRKLHRRAATSIVGVLEHHQRRHRKVSIVGGENFGLELIEIEFAIVAIADRREHDAAQRRRSAGFIAIRMGLVADDRLGARGHNE